MDEKLETQPEGLRDAPPPPKLTALAMKPEGPQPDILIVLAVLDKAKVWGNLFKNLGYQVVISKGAASYVNYLNRGGMKVPQFALTDSRTGARMMN